LAAPARTGGMASRELALLWVLLAAVCDSFYLPGVAPHEYLDNERVEIKVNKLSSTKTQV
jgi:transmembrane 9 superfamily protein 2/4